MSSSSLQIVFGIEMELLLRPKPAAKLELRRYGFNDKISPRSTDSNRKQANRVAIYKFLEDTMRGAAIPTGHQQGKFEGWTAEDETALDEYGDYWRCEIVSRILSSNENWQAEVFSVFRVLGRNFDISLTTGCSTHVHVSIKQDHIYTIEQLKRIVKGVIYYDGPITAIMPSERKDNPWADSNVKHKGPWHDGYNDARRKTWGPLFEWIDKHKMPQTLLHGVSGNRYLSWNFSNVFHDCGTIEFRRPPAVDNPAAANHWIAFVVGFTSNAVQGQDWNAVKKTNVYPSTEDLRSAITRGLRMLPGNSLGGLGRIVDDNSPPKVFTRQELARIDEKKRAKNKKSSPFVEKVVRSRPSTPTGHR